MVLLLVLVLPFRSNADLAVLGVALSYSMAQYVNVGHAWYRLREIMPRPFEGTGGFTARLTIATGVAGIVLLVARLTVLHVGRGTPFLIVGSLVTAGVAGVVLLGVFLLIAGNDARRIRAELGGHEPD